MVCFSARVETQRAMTTVHPSSVIYAASIHRCAMITFGFMGCIVVGGCGKHPGVTRLAHNVHLPTPPCDRVVCLFNGRLLKDAVYV